MKSRAYNKKGFTLIEIMVAVSIFVIVAFIVTSTLLAILDAGRRANKIRLIVDNMNFALDSMTYKLKFGENYQLSPGKDQLSFVDRDGNDISYCKDEGAIVKCDNSTGACGTDNSGCKSITTPEITVTNLLFERSSCVNPNRCNIKYVILVKAIAEYRNAGKNLSMDLDFQTSVSQSLSQ